MRGETVKVALKLRDYKMEIKGGKSWWLAVLLADHIEAQNCEDIENSLLFDQKRVFGSVPKRRIIAVSNNRI